MTDRRTSGAVAHPIRICFTELEDGCVSITKIYRRRQGQLDGASEFYHVPAGFDLQDALDWCTANGYTVHHSCSEARAWKYEMEPIRIDFAKLDDGRVSVVEIYKRLKGDRRGARESYHQPNGSDFQAALDWHKENGYTVHYWYYGARAWKGEPKPVRNRREIKEMRTQLWKEWKAQFAINPGKLTIVDTLLHLDLAYDG